MTADAPTHEALELAPGLYQADDFPVVLGYYPVRIDDSGAWSEYDPHTDTEQCRIADPITYHDTHGPLRAIDPREVPEL